MMPPMAGQQQQLNYGYNPNPQDRGYGQAPQGMPLNRV